MEAVKKKGLHNVIHHSWVNLEELPRWIARADVCLGGPFGNTGQARRVVTGKTYQFLAMAKPTVVGKIDEDNGFRDKENCLLVPQGDGQALAEAIAWALANRERLKDMGKKARNLYLERFSIRCIKASLAPILDFACHSKEDDL